MPKVLLSGLTAAGLAALFIAASSPAQAQTQQPAAAQQLISDEDLKAYTDQRVELVKVVLQLTPAQQKLWPAVEEAIRFRATTRHARLKKLAARLSDERERSPIDLVRERADVLAQRATALKKLADAWQPLYESLDNAQAIRLRVLTLYALREMRSAVDERRAQYDEESYEE